MARFVQRLDYATSGVMCIALNKKSAKKASLALEKRKVDKFYIALVSVSLFMMCV